MDQSRRAVESYWRSRLIDGATSDEDKVTPVYKLEEICELLRSSHVSIVKEVSEFILKRLQHKSPIVKQKALRLIKYAVGKSSAEFRREIQRNSVSVRQLIHYKGHPDPLKGDSLNKAVRETAQEAVSAIFANEDNKASTAENLGGRIQGFGNTNFDFVSEDKKSSFLSEVVNIGSATIKQGISTLSQSPSLKKNDVGTYKGPNLRRSLTTESDFNDQYEGVSGSYGETQSSSRFSKPASTGNWGASPSEGTDGHLHSSNGERTREERLLETIVTSGGVRLQPSRDALHVFLMEASKLDALILSHAIDTKLSSPQWQVRMKAVCVLEALLRKKDEHFAIVATYFSENKDLIINCSESPQASLREKAIKVLSLLDGEQTFDGVVKQEQKLKAESINAQIPNLIDTGDSDNLFETDEHKGTLNRHITGVTSISSPLIDDLLGGGPSSGSNMSDLANDDPFADVSFHSDSKEGQEADIFSGITVDNQGATEPQVAGSKGGPELFDIFGPSSELSADQNTFHFKGDGNDIMAGLSIHDTGTSAKQNSSFARAHSESLSSVPSTNADHQFPSDILNSTLAAQVSGRSTNPAFPLGGMPYNYQPGFVFNPSLVPQSMDYNSMATMLAQQQFLATMSNFQHFGNLQSNSAVLHSASSMGENPSPLPDIFNPSLSSQPPTSLMSSSKKEETKAFDFISDHLAAARDPKRVI